MRDITHYIFDMDGLLLDTEIFYTQVTQRIVSEFGKEFTWALKARMMGRNALESAKLLVNELSLPISAEEYLQRRDGELSRLFPQSEFKPGAVSLLQECKKRNIGRAVATSTNRANFSLKTQRHRRVFEEYFDVVVTGDDTEIGAGKPAPDIFLLAAKRMQVVPGACLVFEDSVSGVLAGVNAGMRVCAVPDPNLDKADFERADLVLNSLNEFDFGSIA
ncbi:MAG: HAD-IA family hydrolase [Nitrospinota bacterium]